MKYYEIGSTGINVSKICVGGMSFGERFEDFHTWVLDQEKSTAMIRHALDVGVNFIDTANVYAHGTSEVFIGKALKELGVPRSDVVIASKVYNNEDHLSKEAILREIDGTLTRLGSDYLDIYYIHRFDYGTPMEETMETLDSLVKAGKVRALGASAMFGYQFQNYQIMAEKNGWTPFSAMQNHYNLLYREDEHEMIPICRQYGVSLIPYSPLAGGHLSHKGWTTETERSQRDKTIRKKYDHAKENDLKIIDRVDEIAAKHGVSMSTISLAWLLAKGANPIVGATSIPHFDDAAKAVDFVLPEEDIKYLEEAYEPHRIVGALKQN